MKNAQVRDWYNLQVAQIPAMNKAWLSEGIRAEERARRAWKIRHDARMAARQLMEDPKQIEELRNRDSEKYGNPDGPSFDYLVQKASKSGLTGDEIYEAIIQGSSTTNADVNRRFGRK